jgi:hypothetical protein
VDKIVLLSGGLLSLQEREDCYPFHARIKGPGDVRRHAHPSLYFPACWRSLCSGDRRHKAGIKAMRNRDPTARRRR